MIKDTEEQKPNIMDNMDDIIAILNSKNYDIPVNRVRLKPLKLPKRREKYDEEFLMDEPEGELETNESEFGKNAVKTQEKFFSTAGSKISIGSKKGSTLSRIRRNLPSEFPKDVEFTEEKLKPLKNKGKSGKTGKIGKSEFLEMKRTPKGAGIKKVRGEKKRGFNIRKLKKKFKGPLNLITQTEGPPKMDNKPVRRRALDDNRLARSKHVLIKTFNRYLSNPSMFIKNSGGFKDLVHLNSNFDDPHLAANLFRTGTDTYSRTAE